MLLIIGGKCILFVIKLCINTTTNTLNARYKLGKEKPSKLLPPSRESGDEHSALVHGVLCSGSSNSSYIDALDSIRQDEVEHNVYVFVTVTGGNPKTSYGHSSEEVGKLVALPAQSRVQDAILALISQYSANGFSPKSFSSSSGIKRVWRNGEIVSLEDTVRNGDVLSVAVHYSTTVT